MCPQTSRQISRPGLSHQGSAELAVPNHLLPARKEHPKRGGLCEDVRILQLVLEKHLLKEKQKQVRGLLEARNPLGLGPSRTDSAYCIEVEDV